MKESRVFELNQATAEQVLEAVTTFLRGEKSMEVQSVATPNGYLIQAAQADTLRTLSGMKLATTVELTVNGTQLNVTLGEGQWADKLGAGAVGLFLLWPLAVTAGIGAYKQKKLPSEIFEVVYRCTMGEPTSFRTAGVPVNAAPTAPAGAVCPQCGAQIFANARFCSACGAKLQTVCPGCGFDIYTHKTTQNRYYLASRLFEMPELKLLADAVESAGFITEKKSEELIEKLCRLTSVYEAEVLQEGFCANNGKSCNESIYYIADTINAAIAKRKKISFYYFHYGPGKNRVLKNDGKPYVFSPYKLVWNTDEYYVVGYSDKHEKLVSFRVDRIDRCPEILDEDAEPRPEKEELMRHIRTMTSMYDSRRERVTLLCDNAMMNAVVDAFGEDVETKAFGDDAFTVETETAASPVFYRWVFGYGGKIRITEPENVKKEYAEMVKNAFGNTCGRCGA